MRHLTFRLAIALLTFVVGVAAVMIWLIPHKPLPQSKDEVRKALPAVQVAQIEQRECGHSADIESYVDALVCSSNLHVVYGDDGAADATVMQAGEVEPRIKEDIAPEVRNIVELGSKAIPLLIQHLDDRRLTSAIFHTYRGRTESMKQVPVGHICLDILMATTKAPKIIEYGCGDDGLGSCVDGGFYFRPDDYHLENGELKGNAIVYAAKKNWQKAYKKGWVKFDYPIWWK